MQTNSLQNSTLNHYFCELMICVDIRLVLETDKPLKVTVAVFFPGRSYLSPVLQAAAQHLVGMKMKEQMFTHSKPRR